MCSGPAGPSHVHASRLPCRRQSTQRVHAVAVREAHAPAHQRQADLPSTDRASWESNDCTGKLIKLRVVAKLPPTFDYTQSLLQQTNPVCQNAFCVQGMTSSRKMFSNLI